MLFQSYLALSPALCGLRNAHGVKLHKQRNIARQTLNFISSLLALLVPGDLDGVGKPLQALDEALSGNGGTLLDKPVAAVQHA